MDLLAYDDMSTFGLETSSPIEELDQDLYHRLIETPGSNLDDPNRGLGIEDRLSGPYDPSLGSDIEHEYRKDARVNDVTATITELDDDGSNSGGGFLIEIDIVADEGVLGQKLTFDSLGLRRAS